jgi:hypothetical protein
MGGQADAMFAKLGRPESVAVPPQLVGTSAGYNIVYLGGYHYSVPQSLGPMDLAQLDKTKLPHGILVTRSYAAAIQAIQGV